MREVGDALSICAEHCGDVDLVEMGFGEAQAVGLTSLTLVRTQIVVDAVEGVAEIIG